MGQQDCQFGKPVTTVFIVMAHGEGDGRAWLEKCFSTVEAALSYSGALAAEMVESMDNPDPELKLFPPPLDEPLHSGDTLCYCYGYAWEHADTIVSITALDVE